MEPPAMEPGAGLTPGPSNRPVAVVGHICLDLIPQFPAESEGGLAPGSLTHVGPALRSTGGAVSNAGLALHRLGMPVRLAGKVGDDLFGDEVLRLLRAQDDALANGMIQVEGETTSYSIVISPPGVDRSFLHCPGANDTFLAADVDWTTLEGCSIVHFGYPPIMRAMREWDGQEVRAIFEAAQSRGLLTSLDMCAVDTSSDAGRVDWQSWLANVLPVTDLFLPSLDEILFMLGRPAGEAHPDLLAAVSEQLTDLGADVVVIKLGDQGLYLRTSHRPGAENWVARELYSPCFEVDVTGTTGAGDCTIAGFLAGAAQGRGPDTCMTMGVAVGACSVESADATTGVPSWSTCMQRVDAGWVHRPLPAPFAAWRQHEHVFLGPRDQSAKWSAHHVAR